METVSVACKLPNGLRLRVAGRKEEFVLRGTALGWGVTPEYPIVGGAAITTEIPADFWAQWWEQYKDADFCRRGFVFAAQKQGDVRAKATELEGVSSGLEGLNTTNLGERIKQLVL